MIPEKIQAYFDGDKLRIFPRKWRMKLEVLNYLMTFFPQDKKATFTEKEVNAILFQHCQDYVTIRRALIDFQYLQRQDDGGLYWVKHYERSLSDINQ